MNDRGAPSPREHLLAFAALLRRSLRSAWVGGIVLAIGLAGTAIWALSTKRIYKSETVVVYEPGVRSGPGGGTIRAQARPPTGGGAETAQLEIQGAQIEEDLAAALSTPGGAMPGEQAGDPVLVAARAGARADLQAAQQNLADKQAHFTNE